MNGPFSLSIMLQGIIFDYSIIMAEEKYGFRLRSKNFRTVISEAVDSIDYNPKAKIIEIEFKGGDVYHYLDAKNAEWKRMLEFVQKKNGLGAYVNQSFKEPYKKGERKYYRLIAPGKN